MRELTRTINKLIWKPFLMAIFVVAVSTFCDISYQGSWFTIFLDKFSSDIAGPLLIGMIIIGLTLSNEFDEKLKKLKKFNK